MKEIDHSGCLALYSIRLHAVYCYKSEFFYRFCENNRININDVKSRLHVGYSWHQLITETHSREYNIIEDQEKSRNERTLSTKH